MSESLHCYIYKSPRKPETYLFVLQENDFSAVPKPLLEALGEVQKVIEIDLTPERKLARGNARLIMNDLNETGFHLQLPPDSKPDPFGPLLNEKLLK